MIIRPGPGANGNILIGEFLKMLFFMESTLAAIGKVVSVLDCFGLFAIEWE